MALISLYTITQKHPGCPTRESKNKTDILIQWNTTKQLKTTEKCNDMDDSRQHYAK